MIWLVALHILADYAGAIAADTLGGIGRAEELIQFFSKLLSPSEELDEPGDVLRNEPERRPAGGFLHHEVVVGLLRVEWTYPFAIFRSATDESDGPIEDISVVLRAIKK